MMINDKYGRKCNYGVSGISIEMSEKFMLFSELSNPLWHNDDDIGLMRNVMELFDKLPGCEFRDFSRMSNFVDALKIDEIKSESLKSLLPALRKWGALDFSGAKYLFEQHIDRYQADVVAIFMKHMLDFSIGQTPEMAKDFDKYDAHINDDHDLYSHYLGMKAFVLNEAGDFTGAYDYGQRACQINPYNVYARHAVAHALHEQSRWHELVTWLEESRIYWQENSGMKMHVCWHLAMAYFMSDSMIKSEDVFMEMLSMKSHQFAKEDLDTVGFLWRHKLRFPHETKFNSIWEKQSVNWLGCIGASSNYFHCITAAIAFAVTGQSQHIEKLIAENDGLGHSKVTHSTGIDVLKAIHAYAIGDIPKCMRMLDSTKSSWSNLGGSNAQREILSLTLKTFMPSLAWQ